MSHRHQSIIDKALGVHNTAGIWQRHREINAQLAENLSLANSRHHSPMHLESDSLGPFMGIMWRTVILHLHSTLSCTASTGKEEYDYAIVESMQRGTLAAQEALGCIERLSQCNSLKVRTGPRYASCVRAQANLANPQLHPITIVPLSLCSELMEAWPDLAGQFNNHLAVIMDATHGASVGDTPS